MGRRRAGERNPLREELEREWPAYRLAYEGGLSPAVPLDPGMQEQHHLEPDRRVLDAGPEHVVELRRPVADGLRVHAQDLGGAVALKPCFMRPSSVTANRTALAGPGLLQRGRPAGRHDRGERPASLSS